MKKKILLIGLLMGLFLTGCNRQIVDLNYKFTKAKIMFGNEVIEIELQSWKDYDDTSIQLIDKNGKAYLTDLKNVILINE